MDGVCDHINHFGSHIKEIGLWKAWGAAMLKGPGENTAVSEQAYWLTIAVLILNDHVVIFSPSRVVADKMWMGTQHSMGTYLTKGSSSIKNKNFM